MAIRSNAVPGARREERARFKVDKMVELLIYSCEDGTARPERRIYEILCERLGVRPEEIIFTIYARYC